MCVLGHPCFIKNQLLWDKDNDHYAFSTRGTASTRDGELDIYENYFFQQNQNLRPFNLEQNEESCYKSQDMQNGTTICWMS